MTPLLLYNVFHLNLAYSSIEVEQRPEVIRRCYRPLLELCHVLPCGIEASGHTLELIAGLDPFWISDLRALLASKTCSLIGSGYTQLIGPLVPARVNDNNLRLGQECYERLLDVRPQTAFVNEQAFSPGLVPLYRRHGYRTIIMEWNNPARAHPEWAPETRYRPRQVAGPDGTRLGLLWNNAIAFQKFQRHAYGELDQAAYLDYLKSQAGPRPRCLSLYGNDAEIFDFRPRRYREEPPRTSGEWRRISALAHRLAADPDLQPVLPETVLDLVPPPDEPPLILSSAADPAPVKKQDKYNLIRWAVTGRDDLALNTLCWRRHAALCRDDATDDEWRELCELWSSDYRTHITDRRWADFVPRMRHNLPPLPGQSPDEPRARPRARVNLHDGRLTVSTPFTEITLNCRRGLAVERLRFIDHSPRWLLGTIPHGYFDDITFAADYYSGHLVCALPGADQVTDLNPAKPRIVHRGAWTEIRGVIPTPLGPVEKSLRVDHGAARVVLGIRPCWPRFPVCSLRLGHLTLNPEAFDRRRLFYRTCNGGEIPETFSLGTGEVDHGAVISPRVSATTALGLTDGRLVLGDERCGLEFLVDKCAAAVVGMMTCRTAGQSYLCRLSFSLREMDDTSRDCPDSLIEHPPRLLLTITPHGRPARPGARPEVTP